MTIVNSYTWYYKTFFFKIPFHSNLDPPPPLPPASVFHPIPLISFLIKKIWSISMTFKMKFVSFRNETKSYIFPWDIFKCDTISFFVVVVFQFQMKFLNLMTKVNRSNGNETQTDIFPWDILKPDIIFH